jgi:hypothetical protein
VALAIGILPNQLAGTTCALRMAPPILRFRHERSAERNCEHLVQMAQRRTPATGLVGFRWQGSGSRGPGPFTTLLPNGLSDGANAAPVRRPLSAAAIAARTNCLIDVSVL